MCMCMCIYVGMYMYLCVCVYICIYSFKENLKSQRVLDFLALLPVTSILTSSSTVFKYTETP